MRGGDGVGDEVCCCRDVHGGGGESGRGGHRGWAGRYGVVGRGLEEMVVAVHQEMLIGGLGTRGRIND